MLYTEKSFTAQNSSGTHTIIYSDWGDEAARPLICVHGLTGNGHDFDRIAPALAADGRRVIAIDLAGRGRSDFLPDPRDYTYGQYIHDLDGLLDHAGIDRQKGIDWLGVSLGGLLGIRIAGERAGLIDRLILNDVGPTVPRPALDFIHKVISQTYEFDTIPDLEKRMRETRGLTWGPMSDADWAHMAAHNARALENGMITYSYDPNIAAVFEEHPTGEVDLWPLWDRIRSHVFLLHGKKSVILTQGIVDEMKTRGPGPTMDYHLFKDCGHVPSLMDPGQIEIVRSWLNKTRT